MARKTRKNGSRKSETRKGYEREIKRIYRYARELKKRGYEIDTEKLPEKNPKRATSKMVESLQEDFSARRMRGLATKDVEGETKSLADVQYEEKQERYKKKREKRRQEYRVKKDKAFKEKVERESKKDEYEDKYEFVSEKKEDRPKRGKKKKEEEDEDLPTEGAAILDILDSLLNPNYYKKDKKKWSDFTEEATENIKEIKKLIDEARRRINDGDTELYNRIKSNINEIYDLIYALTLDYVSVMFYPDMAKDRLYELLEGYEETTSSDTEETDDTYYAYYSSSEEY